MNCRKAFFWIFFLCFISLQSWAQLYQLKVDSGQDRFEVFGVQAAYNAHQELKLTDQVYSGYGGGIHAGWINFKNDTYREFQFIGGYEHTRSPNGFLTHQPWGNFHYRFLWMLKQSGPSQLYVGPVAEVLGQFRYTLNLDNNSVNGDLNGNLGASLHWNYSLDKLLGWERWRLYSDFRLPLISYMVRPNYTLPSLPPEHGISLIGTMARTSWEAGIHLPASQQNTNQYRLWYRWDFMYHKDNSVQALTFGRHFIGFSYLFNTHNSLGNEGT